MNEKEILISHALDKNRQSTDNSMITHTNFLSLDEISIVKTTDREYNEYTDTFYYGGYSDSERQIAMFIPNTYEVYWNISPEKLLYRISREYSRFWNEERTTKLKRCKLSKYEVMTLASIVYEETKIASEMRMIAGVYINRLRAKIALGACPTIKYAMGDFELKRILHKHLTYRSPFNTYTNRGLPPAPICVPSIEAIDAVLNYAEHKYLYFCARPELDGRHNFARTLSEHNVNAQKYSAALERLKIK